MNANYLKAKIEAVNEANAYAADLYTILSARFAPLVGKKILKADGTLLAKYADLAADLPCEVRVSVYRNVSNYTLGWTVKTCVSVPPHGCVYHETTVYIGNLTNHDTLKSIVEPAEYRIDYTAAEVIAKRVALKNARQAMETARTELYPFGEFDNN